MSSAFAGPSAYPGALGQLRSAPRLTYAAASRLRREQQWRESAVRTLDRIAVLGGPSDEHASSVVGHEGCVNALAWSDDGTLLASGSDDRRICLWKLGSDGVHQVDAAASGRAASGRSFSLRDEERGWPDPGVGLATVVETGHRANIFSVKFAPHSTSRFFTAAGDSQMRVFDLSLSSAEQHSRITPTGSYDVFPERGGACTRVLKCHTARVKRISVEGPDTFLSCAEDGEVRQTDLRVNHTCKRSRSYGQGCPAPLLRHSMELYSLSVSKQEPWLFVVAGTSEYAYLHDRRMVPRLIQQEWGVVPRGDDGALTTCVRRFGRPDEGWDVTDKAGRDGSCHITAAKIEETMGRDLLLSYSGADSTVYRFNIHDEPGRTHHDVSKHQPSIDEVAALHARIGTARVREDEAASPEEPSRMDVFRARIVGALFPRPSDSCDPHKVGSDLLTLGMLREVVEADHEAVAVCRALVHLAPWASGPADFSALSTAALSELVIEDQPPVAPELCAFLRQLAESTDAQATYEQIWSVGEAYVRERWPQSWDSERRARAVTVDIRELLGDDEGQPPPQDMGADEWTDEDEVEGMSVDDETDESEEEASESNSDSDDGSESSEHDSEQGSASETGNAAFNAPLTHPRQRYQGHINVDTVKQVDFVGDGFVASGSDCGRLFVWSSETGELLAAIRADGQVVNVSVAHPTLPLLAVSGIDDEIKLLGPSTARAICREADPDVVAQANRRNGGMRNSFGYSRGLLALLQQQATMGPEAQCPTQ